jgi:hypothetical protein
LRSERLYGLILAPKRFVDVAGGGPSLSLPLLELCLGTSPIQAEKSRPDRNVFGAATLATRAVASLPYSGGAARLIVPVYCGIRPRLKGRGEPAADFMTPAHRLTACNRTMARSNLLFV